MSKQIEVSGHTKGPWKARMGEILGADGATVADTRTSPRDDDEVIANAALIASAPDLLAELERIANGTYTENTTAFAAQEMQRIAREAVAKAGK